MVDGAAMHRAVQRLAAQAGSRLRDLGEAAVDRVTVRRFREALGLAPDPALGIPPLLVAHLLRPDADVARDVRPVEGIDDVLADPVNGGTEVRWERPLQPDEPVRGELVLVDASLREGRSGPLAIVVTETRLRDARDLPVAAVRSTMVYRGTRA